jgi:Ca2+-binding RTX toxin-like protein
MAGGGGNDTYTVDDVGDVVVEATGAGTDHVRSSVSYTLGAFVENLTLLGTNNTNASGNLFANIITGNSGNNIIAGGFGMDTLAGGSGSDVFRFQHINESGLSQSTADLITDFAAGQADLIDFSTIDAIDITSANEAFVYIGSSAFTAAGQVRSFVSGSITYIALNTNADPATVEMMIALSAAQILQSSSFIL